MTWHVSTGSEGRWVFRASEDLGRTEEKRTLQKRPNISKREIWKIRADRRWDTLTTGCTQGVRGERQPGGLRSERQAKEGGSCQEDHHRAHHCNRKGRRQATGWQLTA